MALKDLFVPTVTIKTSGGEFAVRGLSLNDILRLVEKHRASMNTLFQKFVQSGEDLGLENSAQMGAVLVESAPDVAAEIIALAADEPDQLETVKSLSFPVQLDTLEQIGRLTFEAAGGPKKVVETVIRVIQGATNLLGDLQTSKPGSGA